MGVDIVKLTKDTVEQYYDINETQRKFLLNVVRSSKVDWNKYELMKVLMIYNKANELGCSIDDKRIDDFALLIDKHSSSVQSYLEQNDNLYREKVGCF